MVELPHCPAVGVNVYLWVPTVVVFIIAGLQVPVMPFVDVVGSAGAILFRQSGPIALTIGVV